MSAYRDSAVPTTEEIEAQDPARFWGSLVCTAIGCGPISIFHVQAQPWFCHRCGRKDLDGLSPVEFLDALDQHMLWLQWFEKQDSWRGGRAV